MNLINEYKEIFKKMEVFSNKQLIILAFTTMILSNALSDLVIYLLKKLF